MSVREGYDFIQSLGTLNVQILNIPVNVLLFCTINRYKTTNVLFRLLPLYLNFEAILANKKRVRRSTLAMAPK